MRGGGIVATSSTGHPLGLPVRLGSTAVVARPPRPRPTEAATALTVVIPTYNERENLAALLPKVLALGPGYRVLVVDDNSPDGTGALADEFAARHPDRIRVLHRTAKEGLGAAYVAGLQLALEGGSDLIATMDADHSHDPNDLPRLAAAAQGADLAIGSRYAPGGGTRGWPRYRRFISRFGGRYARAVLGVPVNDLTGGYKVFRRETLAALDLGAIRSDGYAFNIEVTYRAWRRGARVAEVPIVFTDRVIGSSKLSRGIILEAMVMVWRMRFGRR